MKKYYFLILFFCLGFSVNFKAQFIFPNSFDRSPEDNFFAPTLRMIDFNSISNFHFFNPYAFNPAMAGIEDKRQFNFDWNRQDNHSASISYEQPITSFNSAIGVQYDYSERNFGKVHRYGLAYNYGFRWKENTQLRIGMQFSQVNIKLNKYSYLPLEENEWYSFPSIDFGLAFQYKQLRLGASVQNLVPKEFPIFNERTEIYDNPIDTKRTLNLSAANTFKLSKKWDWSVVFLLRFNSHTTFNNNNYYYYYNFERNRNQHDFSSYISFRKKVTIGATYRTQFDPIWIGFVGVKLKEKLNLQFSFNVKKDKYDPRFWEALVQYAF